uniref:Putative ovule protein n=1 Tax=Solanum chacoense TaxID=4108 RepID=A0A0V0HJU7_SOLCH
MTCMPIPYADVGIGDTAASDEKWSAFDAEQKEIIEKHINSLRLVIQTLCFIKLIEISNTEFPFILAGYLTMLNFRIALLCCLE